MSPFEFFVTTVQVAENHTLIQTCRRVIAQPTLFTVLFYPNRFCNLRKGLLSFLQYQTPGAKTKQLISRS